MAYGLQTRLAREANVSVQFINEVLSGRKNASYIVASRIAEITKSRVDIWQLGGGTAEQRQEALKNWYITLS